MPRLLIERLNAERRRLFIGRQRECDQFEAAVRADSLPFSVLHIFGLAGVGKTTLLQKWMRICKAWQIPAVCLNARTLDPSPESFLNALGLAMQGEVPPIQVLASQPNRFVVFIDNYERLAGLDDWLREVFLPQLSEQVLVVLAGRCSPTSAWRVDPGWQTLLQPIALQNLTLEESQLYLTKRGIPIPQHPLMFDLSQGHPLALSLVSDAYTQRQTIQPEPTSELVKTLLEKFLEEVPSAAHRRALEACAMVHLMTEALLAEMLEMPEVHELFEWLRRLSFIQVAPAGLVPHRLARDILTIDLRWRSPIWYAKLHQRARTYYSSRLEGSQGHEQQQTFLDYMYLYRHCPIGKFFNWDEQSRLRTEPFQECDRAALLQLVRAQEGDASVGIASHWLTRQPQNVLLFREADRLMGFMITVALHSINPDELHLDPAAENAWQYLQNHAPLRLGESALLYRFWIADNDHKSISSVQQLMVTHAIQQHRNTAGIAFTFIACAKSNPWLELLNYADFSQISEKFQAGEQSYSIYGHDWRVISAATWQERLLHQEIAPLPSAKPTQVTELPLVLGQLEFVAAVQEALRYFTRPDLLQNNPLLRSRWVLEQSAANVAERISVLQAWVREATETLQASPRDQKLYRALYRTYLSPALTQEQAAEALNLPFSTYRRHLKAGVTRVAGILWQWEIQGSAIKQADCAVCGSEPVLPARRRAMGNRY